MNNQLTLESAPHDLSILSTGKVMRILMLSLIPALIANVYYFGFGIAVNLLLCTFTCTLTEAIILKLRKRSINIIWRDCSALVTGVILAFTLPQLTPWYLSVFGCVFAIALVKHAFGGLGQNIFNPAMAGFVFLLISAPLPMTTYVNAVAGNYQSITFNRALGVIFNIDADECHKEIVEEQKKLTSVDPENTDKQNNDNHHARKHDRINQQHQTSQQYTSVDGKTGATEVDGKTGATELEGHAKPTKPKKPTIDAYSGPTFLVDAKHEQPNKNVAAFTEAKMGAVLNSNFMAHLVLAICYLFGGLVLLFRKVIDYRIPLAFITASIPFMTICWLYSPETYLSPFYHYVFGATIFGAFYIMTDPVTAVSKPTGALAFGAIIGILFVIIRNFGGYPDSMAFSVLIGNSVAPLISVMTKRREFGANSKPGELNDR